MTDFKSIWEQVFEFGFESDDPSTRQKSWDIRKKKYDATQIIGSWIRPRDREVQHLLMANRSMQSLDPSSYEYMMWYMNSQVHRIRMDQQEGGSSSECVLRNLLEIAFHLGGIGSVRTSVNRNVIPPLTNYVTFA